MAKTSQINRNKKREKLVALYAAKRAALKAKAEDMKVPAEERFEARLKLGSVYLISGNVDQASEQAEAVLTQDPQNAGGHVHLPFDGDNMLSLILSKAFLLAHDDKIKDQSIVSQIKNR